MGQQLEKFPRAVSLTLTNLCNMHCEMCGQWGDTGYMKEKFPGATLPLESWKKVIQEVAEHKPSVILLRGGEPFLYPKIIPLLSYIKELGLFVSIDTNGTLLEKYAQEVVDLGIDNINLSIDGPEAIHDEVRGVKGAFQQIKKGVLEIQRLSSAQNRDSCVKVIAFTITPTSYKGLPLMPDVARELGIPSIAIVPYYFIDKKTGEKYEAVMEKEFNCKPFSWTGFFREHSGIDPADFLVSLREFISNLREVQRVPFMDFAEDDYVKWFADCETQVGKPACSNAWHLIDIQPDGEANFCVDFPDYSIGNVHSNSIEELWNNEKANQFRQYIQYYTLPVCDRCGAKYM